MPTVWFCHPKTVPKRMWRGIIQQRQRLNRCLSTHVPNVPQPADTTSTNHYDQQRTTSQVNTFHIKRLHPCKKYFKRKTREDLSPWIFSPRITTKTLTFSAAQQNTPRKTLINRFSLPNPRRTACRQRRRFHRRRYSRCPPSPHRYATWRVDVWMTGGRIDDFLPQRSWHRKLVEVAKWSNDGRCQDSAAAESDFHSRRQTETENQNDVANQTGTTPNSHTHLVMRPHKGSTSSDLFWRSFPLHWRHNHIHWRSDNIRQFLLLFNEELANLQRRHFHHGKATALKKVERMLMSTTVESKINYSAQVYLDDVEEMQFRRFPVFLLREGHCGKCEFRSNEWGFFGDKRVPILQNSVQRTRQLIQNYGSQKRIRHQDDQHLQQQKTLKVQRYERTCVEATL